MYQEGPGGAREDIVLVDPDLHEAIDLALADCFHISLDLGLDEGLELMVLQFTVDLAAKELKVAVLEFGGVGIPDEVHGLSSHEEFRIKE